MQIPKSDVEGNPLGLPDHVIAIARQLLDAVSAMTALLDANGCIVLVNDSWHRFASSDDVHGPAVSGVGHNYMERCAAVEGDCALEAHAIARGIRDVLFGANPTYRLDYRCRVSSAVRWFRLTVSPFRHADWLGALLTQTDVTDLVQAEHVAQNSESLYRTMFERNSLPMWTFDPQTLRFLAVNNAAIKHYGYSREEFLAMTVEDIRPPADLPSLYQWLAELDTDVSDISIWRHHTKDGRQIRVEARAQWVLWTGRPARLVTVIDVTERLAATEALAESEQRFRELAHAISEVFWLTDLNRTQQLYVSLAYESIWGRSCAALYEDASQWLKSVHPDDTVRVRAAQLGVLDVAYNLEYRIIRPDGSLRWISDRGFPIHDADGVVRRVAGLATDITSRHADQSRLRLLQTAIDRLNDIVLITEAEPFHGDGPRIVFVNDTFERRTGYSREEVICKTPRMLQGPDTQRSELDRISAALERWEPVRAELINYTKAGDPFWLELDIVPIADDAGWYTHWVAVERDITERKLAEDTLRQSQHLEALGQLTGGVAHDFNNLLTVIQGNAELLSEQLSTQPRQHKLAQQIERAALRSAELTKRLLAFARKQVLEPRAVDLNRLLTEMLPLLQRSIGEQVEIDLFCGTDLWTTLVDPSQLENAVLNLAINARDAMPEGGRLTIGTSNLELGIVEAVRTGQLTPGAYVLMTVCDSGTGIPQELLHRVFQPFFTTKERGKGTGLGLAMVYGFVKQSLGHIALESDPGCGTRIVIYLPRHNEAAHRSKAAESEDPAVGHGQYVLLVEDDVMVRAYAHAQLLDLGYRVVEAATGPEGLLQLRAHPEIELLFTDVVMPGGMSGRDLVDAAHVLRPGLPVLYTSGYPADTFTREGKLEAGVLMLSKPYRRLDLARKLRDAFAGTA